MTQTFSKKILREINIFFIIFFGVSIFMYLLLNGGAYWRILRYTLFLHSPFASAELKQGDIFEFPKQSVGTNAARETASFSPKEKENSETIAVRSAPYGEFRLVIPKIDVNVPLITPKENTKESILASLEEGVGIYPNSAPIGGVGRTVILGHSSRASWYRGEYAYIFSLLPKLEPGDEFFIIGGGKQYRYRVFARTILPPVEANALFSGPSVNSEVDLVTCYPIGSASKRNIVQAELVHVQNL